MPQPLPTPSLLLSALAVCGMFFGCASQPKPVDELQSDAVNTALQRGSTELGCPAATTQVLSRQTIEEPQGTGWYEPPHQAKYTVGVAGCGRRTTYSVTCDDRKKTCVADTVKPTVTPRQLADQLQPGAVRAAQQLGAAQLECPAATTEVIRQGTIEEPQGTGWYEPPHRAVYTVGVSGCGKRTTYLVSCDNRQTACVAGGLQEQEQGSPPTLADKLQPDAVRAAQQSGFTELGCPTVTPKVLRKGIIEEPNTTGWYEPPHRAVYTMDVSGCGKSTTYAIECDDRKKSCVAGHVQSAMR